MATNEHVEKILQKTGYILGEATYKLSKEEFSNDDVLPETMGGPKPPENQGLNSNAIFEDDEENPEEDLPPALGDEEVTDDAIAADMGGEESTPEGGEEAPADDVVPDEEAPISPEMEPEATGEPSVNELQNDLIKLNISAMQQMNDKIASMENSLIQMTSKMQQFDKEVEEVREPTNVEKLMNKKADSHPYYYGLNDMWEGNWFQARRDEVGDRGMKQLEDGTYVADFDTLPKYTDQEIKKSFNV